MRRYVLVTLLIIVMIASIGMLTACGNSEERATDITSFDNAKLSGVGGDILAEIKHIGTDYRDRSYGTEGEMLFVHYLSEKLASYGYSNENQEFTYSNMLAPESNTKLTSTNVVFKKDNPNSDKMVLITSQIDNMNTYEGYNDEGVYAGATGVAIMLELAERLQNVSLPYDVYFVGFGANSMSFRGASEFFDNFYLHHKKVDTLLAIDLSKPIGADHMYMYVDEVDTIHGKYLEKIASDAGLDYRGVPRDKQPMNVLIYDKQPMPYTHAGLFSPNVLFLSSRIPTVNFISMNWEAKAVGSTVERKGMTNIASTKRDNLEFFIEINGEERIANEADMVYTTIMNAMLDNAFVETMEDSINNMPDYSVWSSQGLLIGLRLGLMAIIIIAAVLISSKVRKDLPARSMEEFMNDIGMPTNNTNNVDPFGTDNDPFSDNNPFGGDANNTNNGDNNSSNKGNKDSGDDIFGI